MTRRARFKAWWNTELPARRKGPLWTAAVIRVVSDSVLNYIRREELEAMKARIAVLERRLP